jgi:hypothetical protein
MLEDHVATTTLLFGIHCHQPVDNFDDAVHEAIEMSYRPFFEAVKPFSSFCFSVHFSGWLLEKIEQSMPEFFALMQELAAEGRIEFLSGGYYEPVLASIPSRDRIDQIRKLNRFIETKFGQTPRGVWLTERVWDDGIINDLRACHIEYTLVDDYHFIRAGFDRRDCDGYYFSENGGERIAVFPISKPLRYALPFEPVENAINCVKEAGTAIIFDDGEKFGLWPQTYEWVYEKRWLEDFLEKLQEDESVKTELYGSYLQNERARGIAYLPNVSYFEMGEWSLNPEGAAAIEQTKTLLEQTPLASRGETVLGGGIWKNFFVKYRESNHIHKRMLMLSKLRGAMDDTGFDDLVFRAQTNDVLWHGVFGGLYLPNLRDNAYRYLIGAQAEAAKRFGYEPLCEDIDGDGYDEVLLQNRAFCLLFSTKNGGQLSEFDLVHQGFNLQNTLTRRKESYHDALLGSAAAEAEEGEGIATIHTMGYEIGEEAQKALVFDWYERGSFVDHFSDETFDPERFYAASFNEMGDFADQPFTIAEHSADSVTLRRNGGIYTDEKHGTTLSKCFALEDDALRFGIDVKSDYGEVLWYVCELNLHFADSTAVTFNGLPINNGLVFEAARELVIADPYLKQQISIGVDRPCSIYLYRLSTVSQSEKGVDLTVQSVAIAFATPMQESLEFEGKISFKELL